MSLDRLETLVRALPKARARTLVALAGPPAAGKSTLAAALVDRLGPDAVCVPMDGFHLDNHVLAARGLLHRKGAPQTFDTGGLVHAMHRLVHEAEVSLPDFDRTLDCSIAGRIAVTAGHRIVVVEGNYLACAEPPWAALASLWSLVVFVDSPDAVLRARLLARWRAQGLDADAAQRRTDANDMANVAFVRRSRMPGILTL